MRSRKSETVVIQQFRLCFFLYETGTGTRCSVLHSVSGAGPLIQTEASKKFLLPLSSLSLALDSVDDDIKGRSGRFLGLVEVTIVDVIFVLLHEFRVIFRFLSVHSPCVSRKYLKVTACDGILNLFDLLRCSCCYCLLI